MEFAITRAVALALTFITGAGLITSAWAAEPLPATQRYSQKGLLKNWALTVCLGSVVNDSRDKHDADASASAYREFGHQGIEAYDQLRQLALKYAALKYSGAIPGDFNIMKCIDLYHSDELDRLATRLVKASIHGEKPRHDQSTKP
ncbi:MAG: type VI secretion system amidase immunity protein Tai4 [Burkholderiaceae bacterium]|jgi:hypothetical protein|nr:type VI secretion system amidase immunity protein Tai4 [Burkholderiaceae bacterium]